MKLTAKRKKELRIEADYQGSGTMCINGDEMEMLLDELKWLKKEVLLLKARSTKQKWEAMLQERESLGAPDPDGPGQMTREEREWK